MLSIILALALSQNATKVYPSQGSVWKAEIQNLLAPSAIAVRCVNTAGTAFESCGGGGVGGGLTDTELRASAVPVSGTFWQATQPVSIAAAVSTNATVQNTSVGTAMAVRCVNAAGNAFESCTGAGGGGGLTDAELRATAVPVSGTFWQATQPVSLDVAAAASSTPIGSVSLGNSLGKTVTMKTGTLVTTATTADQVVVTHTVTAGKTFYLMYFDAIARLTTHAATATNYGNCSLESPAGTKLLTQMTVHSGHAWPEPRMFHEPLPFASGVVIRVVCTPGAVTSYTWIANFGGYEK